MLTVSEVAERLKLSLSAIYELIADGQLPSVRLGPKKGAVRVTEEDLQAFIESRRTHPRESSGFSKSKRIKLKHIKL